MKRYFMIFNKNTGEIKGYFNTEIWEYENILEEVCKDEYLKEITYELWNTLIGNDKYNKINCPKLKINNINEFIKEKTEEWNISLIGIQENDCILQYGEYINMFFEEKVFEPIIFEPTQTEKDIKFLAETLKSILEPMMLPSEIQTNTSLIQLQEIINRYER